MRRFWVAIQELLGALPISQDRSGPPESSVGAVRIDDYKYRFIDQPQGWLGEKTKVDVPYLINLRLDPFERQAGQTMGRKKPRNNTSIGSSFNFGVLSSSNR